MRQNGEEELHGWQQMQLDEGDKGKFVGFGNYGVVWWR